MMLLTYKECEVGENVESEQPRGAPDAAPFLYLFNQALNERRSEHSFNVLCS
jgi:hypothetical protein